MDSVVAAIGRIRAAWGTPFDIPGLTDRRTFQGYAEGGWLREPIVGTGLQTGRGYTLAERGPELVVPGHRVGAGAPRVERHYHISIQPVDHTLTEEGLLRMLRRLELAYG